MLGSASGEEFDGPDAVRACLAALTSRPTAHGWRWVDRRVTVAGDVLVHRQTPRGRPCTRTAR